jgi:hypothetical protein
MGFFNTFPNSRFLNALDNFPHSTLYLHSAGGDVVIYDSEWETCQEHAPTIRAIHLPSPRQAFHGLTAWEDYPGNRNQGINRVNSTEE